MRLTIADPALVACCGLYCGACGEYETGHCGGCRQNAGNAACGIRKCAISRGLASCAECPDFSKPAGCQQFHDLMAKAFNLFWDPNPPVCLQEIRGMLKSRIRARIQEI